MAEKKAKFGGNVNLSTHARHFLHIPSSSPFRSGFSPANDSFSRLLFSRHREKERKEGGKKRGRFKRFFEFYSPLEFSLSFFLSAFFKILFEIIFDHIFVFSLAHRRHESCKVENKLCKLWVFDVYI